MKPLVPPWLLTELAHRCRVSADELSKSITASWKSSGQDLRELCFWDDPAFTEKLVEGIQFALNDDLLEKVDATPGIYLEDEWTFVIRPILEEAQRLNLPKPVTREAAAEALRQIKWSLQNKVEGSTSQQPVKDSVVYFIQARSAIKIGCADDVHARLKHLQCANPRKLTLLGIHPGGRDVEGKLHREFKKYRLRGEWFRSNPSLLKYIEDHCTKPKIS